MNAVIALSRLGGVATHAELLDAVPRRQLRRAVRAGLVLRRATDVYTLPEIAGDRFAAARLHGALGVVSAALEHGWKVKQVPAQPTVWVPRGRAVDATRRTGVSVRWGDLTDSERAKRVTSPARTVIDCARLLPFDEALAIADSALRSGDVGPRELAEAAEMSPRTGRRRAMGVVAEASRRAANPMESVLRAICLDIPGLDVRPQVWVGTTGRADLVDEGRRLVIEAESMEFHGTRESYRRDVRRYTDFVRQGYLVLRFCWEDIMLRPEHVRATLEEMLVWWPTGPPGRQVRRRAA